MEIIPCDQCRYQKNNNIEQLFILSKKNLVKKTAEARESISPAMSSGFRSLKVDEVIGPFPSLRTNLSSGGQEKLREQPESVREQVGIWPALDGTQPEGRRIYAQEA